MNEHELLTEFLTHWPESYHPHDEKRFVRWAIEAHRNESGFPFDKFVEIGLSDRAVDYYRDAFRFVGHTLDVLGE